MPVHRVHNDIKKVLRVVVEIKFRSTVSCDLVNFEDNTVRLDLSCLLVFGYGDKVFVEVFCLSEIFSGIVIKLVHASTNDKE